MTTITSNVATALASLPPVADGAPSSKSDVPAAGSLRGHAPPPKLSMPNPGRATAQTADPEQALKAYWEGDTRQPGALPQLVRKLGSAPARELLPGVSLRQGGNAQRNEQAFRSLNEFLQSAPDLRQRLEQAALKAPIDVVIGSLDTFAALAGDFRMSAPYVQGEAARENGQITRQYVAVQDDALVGQPDELREGFETAAARAEIEGALLDELEGSGITLKNGRGLEIVLDGLAKLKVGQGDAAKLIGPAQDRLSDFGGNLCFGGTAMGGPCDGPMQPLELKQVADAMNRVLDRSNLGQCEDGSRLRVVVNEGGSLELVGRYAETPVRETPQDRYRAW